MLTISAHYHREKTGKLHVSARLRRWWNRQEQRVQSEGIASC